MPGIQATDLLACGMPALQAETLNTNYMQKTSTAETVSGAVTFASSVTVADGKSLTVNASATFASAVTFNGNVTLGNATADTLKINSETTAFSPWTFESLVTFDSAAQFNGTANATTLAWASGGVVRLGVQGAVVPVGTTTATGTTLSQMFSVLSTSVADTNDAVVLPAPTTGQVFIVHNAGASSATVFAGTGRTVNGGANVKLPNARTRIFVAENSTTYWSMLGAGV